MKLLTCTLTTLSLAIFSFAYAASTSAQASHKPSSSVQASQISQVTNYDARARIIMSAIVKVDIERFTKQAQDFGFTSSTEWAHHAETFGQAYAQANLPYFPNMGYGELVWMGGAEFLIYEREYPNEDGPVSASFKRAFNVLQVNQQR